MVTTALQREAHAAGMPREALLPSKAAESLGIITGRVICPAALNWVTAANHRGITKTAQGNSGLANSFKQQGLRNM
jgi:hypothetical protein